MKRWIISIILALGLAAVANAQPTQQKTLTTTTCNNPDSAGCLVLDVASAGSRGIQVTGTFTGTLQFEQTIDGSTWVTWSVVPNGVSTAVTSATAAGFWQGNTFGVRAVRVRFSAYSSGSAIVTSGSSQARSLFGVPTVGGDGTVPTGVAAGSVLASNGVGVQGVWSSQLFFSSNLSTVTGDLKIAPAGSTATMRVTNCAFANGWVVMTLADPCAATSYFFAASAGASSNFNAPSGQSLFFRVANIARVTLGTLNSLANVALVNSAGFSLSTGEIDTAHLLISGQNPGISAGGCTVPAITWNAGSAAFKITIGSSCTGVKTVTVVFNVGGDVAVNGWVCDAHDVTTPQSFTVDMDSSTTTAVVLRNYARLTGITADFTAGEVLLVKCIGG